jgi:hypothetical protein
MEDHTTERMELQCRRDDEEYARDRLLGGQYLYLNEISMHWILNHIDRFVSQSQGNKKVKHVSLLPNAFNNRDHDVWDKVGHAIGNLQALDRLYITSENYRDSTDEDDDSVVAPVPILEWEILARILKIVQQNVKIEIDDIRLRTIEEVKSFARAIRGHPTITGFEDSGKFPHESLETLFSTLSTLPALESVIFGGTPEVRHVDESTLAYPESLTELLRVPTLRFVRFNNFSFTPALFQATANALMEGTAVTKLEFFECSFPAVECNAMMTNGLSRNTSVMSIIAHQCKNSPLLYDALAAALPSNSTLRHLELERELGQEDEDDPDCLALVFSALGQNTGLKSLKVDCLYSSIDESLCTAIKNGLGTNETLDSLELSGVHVTDDNAESWWTAFSFLRTNKTLKSLMAILDGGETESCPSAFRINIAVMLEDNASLESLSIHFMKGFKVEAEDYVALVTSLQHNRTLKTLRLHHYSTTQLTDDEDKQMATLLKKNFTLESLPAINLNYRGSDVGAILRLNEAGRRYLIEDGSSISKGVEVLSRVNDDINCVFLHLLENPRLCDRSAVEKVSAGETANSDGGGGGKREQSSAHAGKESHRRLE